jgi:hypothetical protein
LYSATVVGGRTNANRGNNFRRNTFKHLTARILNTPPAKQLANRRKQQLRKLLAHKPCEGVFGEQLMSQAWKTTFMGPMAD